MTYDDEHTSWRDDLRVEEVRRRLGEAVSAAAVAELELPHLVVCRDEETGTLTYSGPFANALAALVFAEHESAVDRAAPDGPLLDFSVAALYPGDDGR